ncbi:hypothetical protein N7539_005111 [Penicillium diatomitis]|uniref:Uncharacterized protein n=1 Tax=Penicillium diatomitis TaxID=2819901 RepID=A0A9W9X6B4_9EURO|nr:uncharacterized protein N7539_005111 [Penicillium diatomitis]KAJ5485123.1 hypothetical protein N7539_005111 [Penicillium diatomitis]
MLCLLPRYTWFPNGQAHYDGPPLGLSWHDSGDHLPEDKERLLRDFDSASFSSDPFNMPFTATTDGNYLSTQNSTYANQEEGRDQRVGGLASIMSVNNGVRYHAPQPALQDVHYTNPSALAMASSDSCSGMFPDSFSLLSSLRLEQNASNNGEKNHSRSTRLLYIPMYLTNSTRLTV